MTAPIHKMGDMQDRYQGLRNSWDSIEPTEIPKARTIGNIWVLVGKTWYLQWRDTHLHLTRKGDAVWYPYITSNKVTPVYLTKPKGWGKNDWAINFEK